MELIVTREGDNEIHIYEDIGTEAIIRREKNKIILTMWPADPLVIRKNEPLYKHFKAILDDPEIG